MTPVIEICGLLYGDYHELHKRFLISLASAVADDDRVRVALWCNQCCQATKDLLKVLPLGRFSNIILSNENVPKYKVMRKLFNLIATNTDSEWVVWFDDDSHITKPDWLQQTLNFIESKRRENICYVGQKWFVHHLPGQEAFIQQSKWYKGRPSELIKGRPGVWFATGSYWWLRADVLHQLDWPDERLSMNGGDTLLGEAVRQQGLPFHHFDYGVKVNDAKRRGFSEKPAGSTVDTRR